MFNNQAFNKPIRHGLEKIPAKFKVKAMGMFKTSYYR